MIELAIFDMDGLMIDSERTFLESVMAVSERDGLNVDRDLMIASMGMNLKMMKEFITGEMGPGFDFDSLFEKYFKYRLVYEKKNPPAVKKGLFELLDYLRESGIKTAIATSTYRKRALECLELSGIDYRLFDYIKTGDEIVNSKPHPEIYLKVLEHFGIDGDKAVIFEDSRNGLLSASSAGVRCVVIPDIAVIDKETMKKAYRVQNDLEECIEVIRELNDETAACL